MRKSPNCIVSLISLNHATSATPQACCVIQPAPVVVSIKPYRLDVIRWKKSHLYLPLPVIIWIGWWWWVLHHLPGCVTYLKHGSLIVVSHQNLLIFAHIIKQKIPVHCCIFQQQEPFMRFTSSITRTNKIKNPTVYSIMPSQRNKCLNFISIKSSHIINIPVQETCGLCNVIDTSKILELFKGCYDLISGEKWTLSLSLSLKMKAATGMWSMSSVILSTWVITLSTLSRYLPK